VSGGRTALAAASAGLVLGAALLALLVREPAPVPPPGVSGAGPAPLVAGPTPADPAPADPAPSPAAPPDGLVARARELIARGQGARDEAAEAALGDALEALLRDALAAGEPAARETAALWLAPAEPPGVQELGARLLGRAGSAPARERLVALARERGRAVEVRLHALRGLEGAPELGASGALVDLANDRRDDPGLRAFAAHLLGGAPGGAAFLEDLALDRQDDPQVRGAALEGLFAGPDLARARSVLAQVQDEPALVDVVAALRAR
jgi:hypothetical protein